MKLSKASLTRVGALLAPLALLSAAPDATAQTSAPAPAARAQAKPANGTGAAPAPAPARPATPVVAAAPAAAPAETPAADQLRVVRSEVSTHDFWTVACDHFEAPAPARCLARMPVFRSNELKQVLIVLSVSKGPNDQWLLNLHVPSSIVLPPGAEIRFGDKAARRVAFQSCEPALCTASLPLDAALRAELSGAANGKASWASLIGGDISTEFPLRGAAPALAALLGK